MDVGVVFRNVLDDRSLSEPDADDEVVTTLGKCPHGRLDVDGRSWLDVAHDDAKPRLAAVGAIWPSTGLGAFDAVPGRRIERAIVFAADVEHDADLCRRGIAHRV